MVSAQDWSQLAGVVGDALELGREDRARYVAQHCTDPELRARALALLDADERAGDFLERPAYAATPVDAVPSTVGPYRVIRRLGQGGMGEVYLAARGDNEFRREVAVKVLAPGLSDPGLVQRFRAERQILADLDHPNIARLHGGGTLADGRPYLLMEYIDGVPLHRHCERGLSLNERLTLFLSVCEAVCYAHRNLVLHLDLKPHNVLVTRDGVPKLLDFGIAKLLAAGAEPTCTGRRPLTPQYASPEQLRGGPLTTASDVYSLGVMLYRLLSGIVPDRVGSHDFGGGLPQAPRDPGPPSAVDPPTRLTADWAPELAPAYARLRRQLVGDLDAIVLKALRPHLSQRYATVSEFTDDIRRYQANLPVHAHRGTLRYRLSKLVRRRRGTLLVAGAGFALAGGFTVATQIQLARVERYRRQAEHERRVAHEVSALVVERMLRSPPASARPPAIESLGQSVPRSDQSGARNTIVLE